MSVFPPQAETRAEAERLLDAFVAAGATRVEADILLPAETLLDLYGEDIRARAFITDGPGGAEALLRPDFTVPVVQKHVASGGGTARYAYAGKVFRRQTDDPHRPSEYYQAGFELFGGDDRNAADAEVFALFHDLLSAMNPRIVTGDTGLLTAAVRGLATSDRRKEALLRHIWRPRRFRSLIARYAGQVPVPIHRQALLGATDPMAAAGPAIGLRHPAEVAARIEWLRAEAAEPPISATEVELINDLLGLQGSAANGLQRLRDLNVDLPAIGAAVDAMARRLEALDARGIDPASISFETGHGRSSMEYYDGFVFSFMLPGRPDLPALATGGRYDALTRMLGGGRAQPAVGGVIRPALSLIGREGAA